MKAYGRSYDHQVAAQRAKRKPQAKEWRNVEPYMAPRPKRTDLLGRMSSSPTTELLTHMSDAEIERLAKVDPHNDSDV